MSTKTIPFEGIYWWSDSQNVVEPLLKELGKALGEVRISNIKIVGSDFQDGRQVRTINIRVSDLNNSITIDKDYD